MALWEVGHAILTDNIVVLDHIFNFTKKSNLIGRLYYDLTQFFDNLGVAYFFEPPCISFALSPAYPWSNAGSKNLRSIVRSH